MLYVRNLLKLEQISLKKTFTIFIFVKLFKNNLSNIDLYYIFLSFLLIEYTKIICKKEKTVESLHLYSE